MLGVGQSLLACSNWYGKAGALLELVCSSLRLREVVASGATSLMSPDTPKSAVRLRVNTAESEVFMAKV